jgi:hypothetical protein
MAESDSGRVEPRPVLVGMGIGSTSTPERIAEIEQRAKQVEKLTRPKPTEEFSQVLARRGSGRAAPQPTVKEEKLQALPKRGPRPSLVHPAQREVFGRDVDEDETVVLKG